MDEILAGLLPNYAAMSDGDREKMHAQAKLDERRRRAALEQERLGRRYRAMVAMGVPMGEHIDIDMEQSDAALKLNAVLGAFRSTRRSKRQGLCVVMAGPNGVGKSTAAVQRLYHARGRPWYATAFQVMAFGGARAQPHAPPWRADIYVLDQMGHERRGDKMEELFTHVLRTGAVLIATTDLTPGEFRERYRGHIADRVDQVRPALPYGALVHCTGKNWRLEE